MLLGTCSGKTLQTLGKFEVSRLNPGEKNSMTFSYHQCRQTRQSDIFFKRYWKFEVSNCVSENRGLGKCVGTETNFRIKINLI